MANILERAAAGLGGMVGAFEKARALQVSSPNRPNFLSDWAGNERWKGGDIGEREAAQRRALQNSWFLGASLRKAEEVSAAAAEGYSVYLNASGKDPVTIQNHPWEMVMRRPNPVMGQAFLWRFTQMWLDLDGNTYWFICPDRSGKPAEVWPLPSNCVNVVPGDKDRFVDYYEFSSGGVIWRINSEYVCHFQVPNPFDIFRGLSSLTAGMLPVDSDNAMSYWNGALFGENNVMPSVVINLSSGNPDAPIDEADLRAFKSQLQTEYQAWMRKTAVTSTYKMEVNPVGWSQKDADFLNGRQFSKEEIFFILGVPAGLYDKNATEANATVAKAQLKEVIWSELVLLAEQLNAQVVTPFYGSSFESKFEDIRLANRQLELQEAVQAERVLTVDEIRQRYYGAPALPDGRGKLTTLELSSGMGAAEAEPAGSSEQPMLDSEPSMAPLLPEAARADLKRWREREIRAAKSKKSLVEPFVSSAIPRKLMENILDGLELAQTVDDVKAVFSLPDSGKGILRSWRPWSVFEERLTDQVENFLSDQAQRLLDDIDIQANGPTATSDPETWTTERERLLREITPTLLEIARSASGRVRNSLGAAAAGVDWNLANDQAVQWARDNAGQLVRRVTDTTRKEVASLVSEWAQSSEGLQGLVDQIASLGDDDARPIFNRVRAERIAVTEATNTYAGANSTAWSAAGYAPAAYKPGGHVGCRCYIQPFRMPDGTKVMVWYTARDERVCAQPLKTPWGTVSGCRALHRTVISEGQYMGKKV